MKLNLFFFWVYVFLNCFLNYQFCKQVLSPYDRRREDASIAESLRKNPNGNNSQFTNDDNPWNLKDLIAKTPLLGDDLESQETFQGSIKNHRVEHQHKTMDLFISEVSYFLSRYLKFS